MGVAEAKGQKARKREEVFDFPQDLIDDALRGDQKAREEFWDRMLQYVTMLAEVICRKKSVPRPDMEDVVQNTVIAIHGLSPARILGIENWGAWLYRVTLNQVISQIRRRARHDAVRFSVDATRDEDADRTWMDVLVSSEHSPDQAARVREILQRLDEFLGGQPKDNADVFRLYVQGWAQKDISAHTGQLESTVGVWIYRMKKMILQRFKHLGLIED